MSAGAQQPGVKKRQTSRNRSTTLDAVRGVAIVAVVAVHAWEEPWGRLSNPVSESSMLFQGISLLRYGVELFFALSGWLLFALYYRRADISATSYWLRRILRIWPLWVIFSVATLIALWLDVLQFPRVLELTGPEPAPLTAVLLVVFFLGWLSPYTWQIPPGGWSIQVEVGHYLAFWPLRRLNPAAFASTMLVGYGTYFVARALAVRSPEEFGTEFARSWLRLGVYGTWPFFVLGGLAYLWSRDDFAWTSQALGRTRASRLVVALCVAAVLALTFVVPVPLGKSYEAIITAGALLAVALLASRWAPLKGVLVSMGRYSYFMYFAHFWVIAIVLRLLGADDPGAVTTTLGLIIWALALFVVSLLVSWLLGRYSWRFFEAPILRLAHRRP